MKRKYSILSFALVVLIAVMVLTGCNGNRDSNNVSSSTPTQEGSQTTTTPQSSDKSVQDIGQGKTVFKFEVTDNNKKVTAWNVYTNEKTVGEALLAVGLVHGNTSNSGLMVTEVNGLKANYDADKSWWAFYIDGEMATVGVSSTDIDTKKTYSFVYTKS